MDGTQTLLREYIFWKWKINCDFVLMIQAEPRSSTKQGLLRVWIARGNCNVVIVGIVEKNDKCPKILPQGNARATRTGTRIFLLAFTWITNITANTNATREAWFRRWSSLLSPNNPLHIVVLGAQETETGPMWGSRPFFQQILHGLFFTPFCPLPKGWAPCW